MKNKKFLEKYSLLIGIFIIIGLFLMTINNKVYDLLVYIKYVNQLTSKSTQTVKQEVMDYLKKFNDNNLYIVSYNIYNINDYRVNISSKTSIDTNFKVNNEFYTLTDTYNTDVANKKNTYIRYYTSLMDQVKTISFKLDFDILNMQVYSSAENKYIDFPNLDSYSPNDIMATCVDIYGIPELDSKPYINNYKLKAIFSYTEDQKAYTTEFIENYIKSAYKKIKTLNIQVDEYDFIFENIHSREVHYEGGSFKDPGHPVDYWSTDITKVCNITTNHIESGELAKYIEQNLSVEKNIPSSGKLSSLGDYN